MSTFRPFLCTLALAVGAGAFAAPPKVNPEAPDLDSAMEAKVARLKAKATMQGGDKGKSTDGCGNVNIASDEKKKPGSGLVGQDKTVVIVGDVVNLAKCK